MFLLDTNVISEIRKAGTERGNKALESWAREQERTSLFISVITILELETGILQIERRDGKQGQILRAWLDNKVLPSFSDRILPITTTVARQCARLHVPDPQSDRDAMIAATALVHGMTVVTRNVADFVMTGVKLLNPWVDQ